jgi:hypothetical protein
MSEEDKIKILDRIKKLLALGTSPNKAEAESAVAKAHELLKNHNLELSDVEVEDSEVIDETYMESGKTQGWRIGLMIAVARLNFCSHYMQKKVLRRSSEYDRAKTITQHHFIGKPHNVAVVRAMVDYLFQAIDRLGRNQHGIGRSEVESYKAGIADELMIRIKAMELRDKVAEDSRALVVQEAADVEKYAREKLNLKQSPIHSAAQKNWEAYAHGRLDGKNISLNDQLDSKAGKADTFIK